MGCVRACSATRSRTAQRLKYSPRPIWSIRRRSPKQANPARSRCSRATRSALWCVPASRSRARDLLGRMLDPAIKLGTSTPKADPSGDYAFEVFRKADGSEGRRERCAVEESTAIDRRAEFARAAGGQEPVRSNGRGDGQADIFLVYCTAAIVAQRENPGQQNIALAGELAVGADYGLTVIDGASNAANASRRSSFRRKAGHSGQAWIRASDVARFANLSPQEPGGRDHRCLGEFHVS